MDDNTKRLFGSKKSDDWETPKELYDNLNKEFNFNFDPCPLNSTFDGLKCDWKERCFVNPPYSKIKEFLIKAHQEIDKENTQVAVFLTFANTDTKWFHDYILGKAEIRFIKGRLKFQNKEQNKNYGAMRPSLVCILRNKNENK
jgi:site-specific DNA-methyltransferase (adenine-specific)